MSCQGERQAAPSNPVRWFEIYVEDMARAKPFYEALLGVTLTHMPNPDMEMWAFPGEPKSYGTTGTLVRMPGVAPGGNSVLVYFGCDDCELLVSRAVAAGGKVHKGKTSIGPYGHIALLYDTEGNMFGVHSSS